MPEVEQVSLELAQGEASSAGVQTERKDRGHDSPIHSGTSFASLTVRLIAIQVLKF
jgi:hypothetical protein